MTTHKSSCAVHNAPAYPPGPCDCGAEAGDFVERVIFMQSEIDNLRENLAHAVENTHAALAEAAVMRGALRELSGQIIQGRVGFGLAVCPSLDPILAQTELALSTDAGRKVLDVVRAVGEWRDLFEPGAVEATVKIDAERRILMALSALGWKP